MCPLVHQCVCVCHRGFVHPAALRRVVGVVRSAAQRVPQLPHAERVAKKRVSASHYRPELRQREGELENELKKHGFVSAGITEHMDSNPTVLTHSSNIKKMRELAFLASLTWNEIPHKRGWELYKHISTCCELSQQLKESAPLQSNQMNPWWL